MHNDANPAFKYGLRPQLAKKHKLLMYLISLVIITSCNTKPDSKLNVYSLYSKNQKQKDWKKVEAICFVDNQTGSENLVAVRSLWDQDSLYILFDITDEDLRAYQRDIDHPKLFLDDMVEVLIDPNNDKGNCWNADDIVYHINVFGVKKDDQGTDTCKSDAGWNGNARFFVKLLGTINDTTDIDNGYSIMIRIPWNELSNQPKAGLSIGVNFANGDNDGKGRQLFDWVGAWPMRSPSAFGTLILTKENNK